MTLPTYGLLIGRPVASRPQAGGHPHWLVMVQPSLKNHPAYRVAVNLASTEPGAPPEITYQIIDVAADGTGGTQGLRDLIARLRGVGAMDSFQTGGGLPALDFVRGGLLDPASFQAIAAGANPLKDAFQQALDAAIQADEAGGLLAVFGTGYPVKPGASGPPSTGYTGVDNIHMNQGAFNQVGAGNYYLENGPNQDGGLIFLAKDGSAKAFFVKFQTQSLDTDDKGNPTTTGSPAVDDHMAASKAVLHAAPAVMAALTAPATPLGAPTGYIFSDPDQDAVETYVPDVDTHFHTPFVQEIAGGQQRTPVPSPRPGVPANMDLASIVGAGAPGYTNTGGVQTLQFDLIGDSGAVTAAKLVGATSVGDLMTAMAKQSPPAFCFHVGDVVYYYGEKQFYYGQFAEVFKDYPAPIFAIPGNHDALTFDPTQTPMESFLAAFCAETPGTWDGFGGVRRSTMTQPGVYFTLDTPLVSIIGLYSNAGESGGWLNDQQYAFLLGELQRLKPLHDAKERAVILAIHHLPKWFPKAKDPTSAALDAHFAQAGLWPDAVVVGHAHLYQRVVRPNGLAGAPRDIPYMVNGAGGYGIVATQKSGGAYLDTLPASYATVVDEEGFLRATVTKTAAKFTLQFDYHSAKRGGGAAPTKKHPASPPPHRPTPIPSRFSEPTSSP
jgi:uncharacterized protein YukJ